MFYLLYEDPEKFRFDPVSIVERNFNKFKRNRLVVGSVLQMYYLHI